MCLIRAFSRVCWILVLSRLFETHWLESTIGGDTEGSRVTCHLNRSKQSEQSEAISVDSLKVGAGEN